MSNSEIKGGSKKISIHHLYYVLLIAVLIVIALVLVIPYGVSRYAFDNFSFASTITSIVLAVVSIVYSIQSGNSSSDQLNGVRDIERNITMQLNNFSDLEDKLHKKIDEIKLGMTTVKEGQADIKETVGYLIEQGGIASPSTSETKVDNFTFNSLFGNLLLYSCALSFETNRPLPGEILGKMTDNFTYCYGYLVALTVFEVDKIAVEKSNGSPLMSKVIRYDDKTFGTKEQLLDKITADLASKTEVDELKILLNEINEYFSVSKSVDVKE